MSAIYLDHAATTPTRDEVLAAMKPYSTEVFGNPSSSHRWGRAAEAALEGARAEIATSLGAKPPEIRFVRGGTESDNLAVIGSCRALKTPGVLPKVVVTAIEHSAVLEAARHLSETGEADMVTLDVTHEGKVDRVKLQEAVDGGPSVTSVMWVNNETGLVLPVPTVTSIVHEHGGTMHSDASQAVGKVSVHVGDVPVDLLTATGHKIGGPRGMGLLFVREGTPLNPLLYGGGQERALRPGTQDVAGTVGLATAIRLAVDDQKAERHRLASLRDALEHALTTTLTNIRVNGAEGLRAPHVSNIGVGGIHSGDALLMLLDLEGVAASGGSACLSSTRKRSHVIAALYGPEDAMTNVRFSFGRTTRMTDIDRAAAVITNVVRKLRTDG